MIHMPKLTQTIKRKLVQIAAFGFTNAHIGNFAAGKIYTGPWKKFCVPGLNCYSCPAASAACPIGALQAVSGSIKFQFSFYVVGFLLAVGVLFGRFICGWLCPFGLFQELLYHIPTPKYKLPSFARFVKYAILLIFVLAMPVLVTNFIGAGMPAFCQYICPAGTLEGGLTLLATHPELRAVIGKLFTLKTAILILTVIGCIFIQRFFCKIGCPLGAIYGLLNKISFYHLYINPEKCIGCGKCARVCPMDVDPVQHPDSVECIRCGKCAADCPTNAIQLGMLPVPAAKTDQTKSSKPSNS